MRQFYINKINKKQETISLWELVDGSIVNRICSYQLKIANAMWMDLLAAIQVAYVYVRINMLEASVNNVGSILFLNCIQYFDFMHWFWFMVFFHAVFLKRFYVSQICVSGFLSLRFLYLFLLDIQCRLIHFDSTWIKDRERLDLLFCSIISWEATRSCWLIMTIEWQL